MRLALLVWAVIHTTVAGIFDMPISVAAGSVAILAAAIWREGKDD